MGKILIIEDDPAVRLLMKTTLEQDGHQVSETGTVRKGWTVTKRTALIS